MVALWQKRIKNDLLPDKPDLIVLPEASDRYPGIDAKQTHAYYRIRGNQVRDFWVKVAQEHKCYVAYSAAREAADGSWRNSTQIIDRTGQVAGTYNKNHLTFGEIDEFGFRCGKDAPLIECDFGKVACAICFDLNFNELRLKYVKAKPDLIIFSSMYHGGIMQNYWAYSCRAHFVGAIAHPAPSAIISPVGEILTGTTNYFDFATATVNLDCCVVHLDYNWDKLAAMKKKYGAKVKAHDPGFLGSVLISSETDEFDVHHLVKEFEIELLDDYFERALGHQLKNTEKIVS
jgi:predicted amidohydrolase